MPPKTTDGVLGWLRNKGYPWEVAVGKMFRDAGWWVAHAPHFMDPVTGKMRELDLRAGHNRRITTETKFHSIGVGVNLSIECKSCPGEPWIVYPGSEVTDEFSYLSEFLLGPSEEMFDEQLGGGDSELPTINFIPRHSGLVQWRTNDSSKDLAFGATGQASSAARALAITGRANLLGPRQPLWFPELTLNFAVVALCGQLFSYGLDSDGKELVKEIVSAAVPFRHDDGSSQHVAIVTEDRLPGFAAKLLDECKQFGEELEEPTERWFGQFRIDAGVDRTSSRS